MNITIVGGHDRMVRQYKNLCEEYQCEAKVYTQPSKIKDKLGSTDLLVLFTNTVSHKAIKNALSAFSGSKDNIVRSHTSSLSALRQILVEQKGWKTMSYDFIISQCAPTLAGIKVGNLFTYNLKKGENIQIQIDRMNKLFNCKGLYFNILRMNNEEQALIYVFRVKQLKMVLDNKNIQKFLNEYGYEDSSIYKVIEVLKEHLKEKDFPHEIGIFLGYPLEDIRDFIKYKGMNYKCVGFWKVYNDENNAKKTFAKFKKCKDIYCKKYAEGFDIFKLTVASWWKNY